MPVLHDAEIAEPAAPGECCDWPVSNVAYHAARDWHGSTSLNLFRDDPAAFHRRVVLGLPEPREESPAMLLGSVVHCLLLEPETFDRDYAVAPAPPKRPDGIDLRKKSDPRVVAFREREAEHEAAMGEFEACMVGRTPVPDETFATANAMSRAVRAHSGWREIEPFIGQREYAVRWIDESGLRLKARFDGIGYRFNAPFHVSVKTFGFPLCQFPRKYADRGYDLQDALYEEGARRALGEQSVETVLAVVSSIPPHDVAVWTVPTDWRVVGQRRLTDTKVALAAAYARMRDGGPFVEEAEGVGELPVPGWVRRKAQGIIDKREFDEVEGGWGL